MRRGWCLGALAAALLSCTPEAVPWPGADARAYTVLRRELARTRDARPTAPWSAGVRITMREPRSGRVLDGRGGIAVAPGRAVRMILVGGAGATVLDAWVTPERWRVAVPVMDVVRRGGRDEPRDLPIGFLRWWFFTPLEGTLFAATFTHPGALWLLRTGDAAVELRAGSCDRGLELAATRWLQGRAERVDECRARPIPGPGDRVRYEDTASGLTVDLVVETLAAAPPEEDAFRDPEEVAR